MNALARAVVAAFILSAVPQPAWSADEPIGAAPAEAPPSPPAEVPAPPEQPQSTDADAATGQWVYTQQYGWIWVPYSEAYTSVPANGYGQPYQYVYYPPYGDWTWVVAPWVWGYGPWPYFGVVGPVRFAWFHHGWWRFPGRFHFVGAPFHGGFAFHGVRPSPFRGGFAFRGVRPAPFRGGFAGRAAVGGNRMGGALSRPSGGAGHARGGGGGRGGHR